MCEIGSVGGEGKGRGREGGKESGRGNREYYIPFLSVEKHTADFSSSIH